MIEPPFLLSFHWLVEFCRRYVSRRTVVQANIQVLFSFSLTHSLHARFIAVWRYERLTAVSQDSILSWGDKGENEKEHRLKRLAVCGVYVLLGGGGEEVD